MERLDAVVIGAGVVGLAVARALALAGREVVVLEAADAIGTETSSRNSEVIHAGIYYPPGSLKARFCVAGKHALYRYCDERGIPYRRCGKLLVATAENQLPKLHAIRQQAEANGVTDLRPLAGGHQPIRSSADWKVRRRPFRSASTSGTTRLRIRSASKTKARRKAGFFDFAASERLLDPHPQPRQIGRTVGAANRLECLLRFRFLASSQIGNSKM